MHWIAQKIMVLDLQCMHYCCQLQIMSGIILLMSFEGSGGISNHSLVLHKDAA